jgi:hypothetical protein
MDACTALWALLLKQKQLLQAAMYWTCPLSLEESNEYAASLLLPDMMLQWPASGPQSEQCCSSLMAAWRRGRLPTQVVVHRLDIQDIDLQTFRDVTLQSIYPQVVGE